MYLCKMISFYFLHIKQQQLLLQRLFLVWKPPSDSLSDCLLISAGLHVSVAPLSIFIRGHASISLATLFPLPLIRPLASFPFLSWHWADLRPEGSKRDRGREDWRKLEGGRKHERKELERARGREGWAREGGKRQRVKQWSGCSRYRQGKGERSAKTQGEKERMGGKERGSPY